MKAFYFFLIPLLVPVYSAFAQDLPLCTDDQLPGLFDCQDNCSVDAGCYFDPGNGGQCQDQETAAQSITTFLEDGCGCGDGNDPDLDYKSQCKKALVKLKNLNRKQPIRVAIDALLVTESLTKEEYDQLVALLKKCPKY